MTYMLESALKTWDIRNKRVLVRADLNVPIDNGHITNDYRLRQIQKTIDYIIHHSGHVLLTGHLGRPTGADKNLSLKNLMPWFTNHGYHIIFAESLTEAQILMQSLSCKSILLLENLRFFQGEQAHEIYFAQTIAKLADYYVNDAFGTLHRHDSSITLVPRFFQQKYKTIGFLVEQELGMLNKLTINPARPFILLLGGCKIEEKIPLIEHLINYADKILLCPAIAFSFMKAMGIPIGKSLVTEQSIKLCRNILDLAKKQKIEILLPQDFQVAAKTIEGDLSFIDAHTLDDTRIGISIGPKTIDLYTKEINQAHTIFYNGLMGFQEHPETLQGSYAIFQAMTKSDAFTVIGGGDTVGAAQSMGFADQLSFCSTGGGATLAYLSGNPLPGIEAIIKPGITKLPVLYHDSGKNWG